MASLPNAAPDLDMSTTASNGSSSAAAMMSNGATYDHAAQAAAGLGGATSSGGDELAGQQQSTPQPMGSLSQQSQQQQASSSARSVKRPRPVKSCTECRKRKLKCDRSCPCAQCTKSNRSCKYATDQDPSGLSDGSDVEVMETPGRPSKKPCLGPSTSSIGAGAGVGSSAGAAAGGGGGAGGGGASSVGGGGSGGNSTTGAVPPTGSGAGQPLGASGMEISSTPVKNGDHAQPSLTLEEVAHRLDRLERIVRTKIPRRSETMEVKAHIRTPPGCTVRQLSTKVGAERTRFFGQNSTRVLIALFPEANHYLNNYDCVHGLGDTVRKLDGLRKMLQAEHRKLVMPMKVFADSIVPVRQRMKDILPTKVTCDRLLSAYIDTNETLYRLIHVPTFKAKYERYWEGSLADDESFLPQLLAVSAIGTRFVAKSKGLGHERMEGVHIPTACVLIRSWLNGVRGKQLVEFTTLQTEVLLLHAHRIMSLERAQESWIQLGKMVRMAMTMGLHRDPSEFEGIPVFQGELRRRLWFTILDMDLQISLVNNLPCVIREGDFTCKPPQNLDDKDLYDGMVALPQGKPIEQTTGCQIQVYASTTLAVRLKAANMVNRIDSITDYQEVIDVGQRLDRYIEDINYVFPRHGLTNHHEKSRQWRWRVIMDMHVRRPLLALYRPLALGAPDAPREIVRTYLRSCMVILRYLDELDPTLPHYREVGDMYLQILKPDIIMSCFSICYYIQNILAQSMDGHMLFGGSNPVSGGPDSMDHLSFASDSVMLGTPSRLISTVQKSVNLLISNQGPGDLRDIVPLHLVFQSVQRAAAAADGGSAMMASMTPPEDVAASMRGLLDTSLHYTNTSEAELDPFLPPAPSSLPDEDHDGSRKPSDGSGAPSYPPPVMPPISHPGGGGYGLFMAQDAPSHGSMTTNGGSVNHMGNPVSSQPWNRAEPSWHE